MRSAIFTLFLLFVLAPLTHAQPLESQSSAYYFRPVHRHKVDTYQHTCSRTDLDSDGDFDEPGEIEKEAHENVFVGINLVNFTNLPLKIDYMRYKVRNVGGRTIQSKRLRPHTPTVLQPGERADVLFPFLLASSDGRKYFHGHSTAIPRSMKPKKIMYEVIAHNGRERLSLRHHNTIGFSDQKRCS